MFRLYFRLCPCFWCMLFFMLIYTECFWNVGKTAVCPWHNMNFSISSFFLAYVIFPNFDKLIAGRMSSSTKYMLNWVQERGRTSRWDCAWPALSVMLSSVLFTRLSSITLDCWLRTASASVNRAPFCVRLRLKKVTSAYSRCIRSLPVGQGPVFRNFVRARL